MFEIEVLDRLNASFKKIVGVPFFKNKLKKLWYFWLPDFDQNFMVTSVSGRNINNL